MLTFKIDLWVDCHSRKCTGEAGARNKCAVVFLLLSGSIRLKWILLEENSQTMESLYKIW